MSRLHNPRVRRLLSHYIQCVLAFITCTWLILHALAYISNHADVEGYNVLGIVFTFLCICYACYCIVDRINVNHELERRTRK